MHRGGQVLVKQRRATVTDDEIAVGSVADRCLLSGVIQTSHFKGVRTVFDPSATLIAILRCSAARASCSSPDIFADGGKESVSLFDLNTFNLNVVRHALLSLISARWASDACNNSSTRVA